MDLTEKLHSIIPANPGFKILYLDDDKVDEGEPVIAWKIMTVGKGFSVEPITTDGEPASNWIGYLCPDGAVEEHSRGFDNLETCRKSYEKT